MLSREQLDTQREDKSNLSRRIWCNQCNAMAVWRTFDLWSCFWYSLVLSLLHPPDFTAPWDTIYTNMKIATDALASYTHHICAGQPRLYIHCACICYFLNHLPEQSEWAYQSCFQSNVNDGFNLLYHSHYLGKTTHIFVNNGTFSWIFLNETEHSWLKQSLEATL